MDKAAAERLVRQALAGRDGSLESLVDLLTPVIQARVARVLLRGPGADGGVGIRQQVEDLSQEVFLTLFAEDGRILRDWRPDEGLSLENFVGLVARRRTLSILRTGKRNPWKEEPTEDEALDRASSDPGPETWTASRDQLRRLLRRLQEELTPLGWHLFDLLLLREASVEEVERQTRLSRDAIYAWRSRLRRAARRTWGKILSESP